MTCRLLGVAPPESLPAPPPLLLLEDPPCEGASDPASCDEPAVIFPPSTSLASSALAGFGDAAPQPNEGAISIAASEAQVRILDMATLLDDQQVVARDGQG
jgi:hypothetical protein